MTSHDDNPWAPRDDAAPASSTPSADASPIPEAPSAWAPEPAPPAVPVSAAPASEPAPAEAPVDRVVVGHVEPASRTSGGAIGRIVAGGVAALLVGGGAFLAFGAATADGGADSPEAAWEQALAALNDEDIIALAEIMEPSERDTVFEAGFDFVDELARLDVLSDDVDMAALAGIDLTLTGFDPRVERPGNGLAHLYLGIGTIEGEIDVANLPLGQLVLDRLDDDQAAFTDSGLETTDPASTPLVAVERDGRWYLSLWYTVAENIRLELDSPLPDLLDRPAEIGGATPEAAVRLLVEEASQLDVRRMIGALDPEEMAVLYDYAPLFLDAVEPATNSFLEEVRASGWTWGFEALEFTTEELGDGLARVSLVGFEFGAKSESGSSFVLAVGADEFQLNVVTVDEFFGDSFSMAVRFEGECVVVDMSDSVDSERQEICADELSDTTGITGFDPAASLEGVEQVGFVTREVDGIWYISPIRTGLDAMITAVEQLDPETLAELVDEALNLSGGVLGGDLGVPMVDLGGAVDDSSFGSIDPVTPSISIDNGDLLGVDLEPTFAYDMDPAAAASEISFWAPSLTGLDITRGVYASLPAASGGDVAIVAVELGSLSAASTAFEAFVATESAERLDAGPNGGNLVVAEDPFGDPILVEWNGDRLVVVGLYGADPDEARAVLELQFDRS